MKRMRGFTLMEIMIAMVVIAILATMATLTYGRYAYRTRRSDAHHLLMVIAHGEERWYAAYNAYTDDIDKLGVDTDRVSSLHAYYTLSVELHDDAQHYEAGATPINAQARDVCGTLTVDNAGRKSPSLDDVAANANGRCW